MILYWRDYLIIFLLLAIFSLYGLRIFLYQSLEETKGNFNETVKQTEILHRENDKMKEEILEQSSLKTIEQKAYNMDFKFTAPDEYFYLR